jgi:hypothetical protein
MIVNYYGILGCECIWDQKGIFLAAPAGVSTQSLQQMGFYCGHDNRWYKQLTPQESAYIDSMKNMSVVDLPANGSSFGMTTGTPYNMEESPDNKKKANILCWISLIMGHGIYLSHYMYSDTNVVTRSPFVGFTSLAALILMIYVRVKYPKNKFGKVLMILYIAEAVFTLVVLLLFYAMCGYWVKDCSGRA